MSEDGGSPRPVDPNAMDVDSVNSPPAVSSQTGEWKIGEFQLLPFYLCQFLNTCQSGSSTIQEKLPSELYVSHLVKKCAWCSWVSSWLPPVWSRLNIVQQVHLWIDLFAMCSFLFIWRVFLRALQTSFPCSSETCVSKFQFNVKVSTRSTTKSLSSQQLEPQIWGVGEFQYGIFSGASQNNFFKGTLVRYFTLRCGCDSSS